MRKGMMISTKGRYALRVMLDLAENQGEGFLPLRDIARRQNISEKYLESILKILVRRKLLLGLRGKGGGYRLARPAQECPVGEVLRLTEGSLAPVACLEEGADKCPRAQDCRTLPLWKKLDELVAGYLDSVTIADLLQENGK